jgi:hypothetical protein
MNGFLPLIEAFLAFALTMLALATAVSALLGVWMRIFRWRSYGFRMSVKSIYDSQIKQRLEAAMRAPPNEKMRLEFVASMTFNLNEEAASDGAEIRKARIDELARTLDRPQGGFVQRAIRFPLFWARTWRSLRFGVDGMPERQYRMRLENSEAGTVLAKWYGPAEWPKVLDWLTDHFTEVGVVATESFRRRSSVRTILIGLFLAFVVNVDAFNLLNTYMSSEEARLSVIEQQEEILAMQVQTDAGAQPVVFTADEYQSRITSAIETIDSVSSAIDSLPESEAKEALVNLQDALSQTQSDLEIASSAAGELEGAIAETHRIAASLVDRFPVGWDTYPNCSSNSRDLRCLSLDLDEQKLAAEEHKWWGAVRLVFKADAAGFVKWFLGVLITGLMVGLGAPFWVQVVDRIVAVRKVVTDAGGSGQSESGKPHGAAASLPDEFVAAVPPPAGTGADARQAADLAAAPAAAGASAGPNGGSNARQAADRARQTRANPPDTNPGSE